VLFLLDMSRLGLLGKWYGVKLEVNPDMLMNAASWRWEAASKTLSAITKAPTLAYELVVFTWMAFVFTGPMFAAIGLATLITPNLAVPVQVRFRYAGFTEVQGVVSCLETRTILSCSSAYRYGDVATRLLHRIWI
jgi:hypothetical protein